MERKIALFLSFIVFTAVITIAAIVIFGYIYFTSPLEKNIESSYSKNIIINHGSSLQNISLLLEENSLITYPKIFEYGLRILGKSTNLKAGEYYISANMNPWQIYNKIHNGDVVVHKITIVEGLTSHQILEIINNNNILKGEITQIVKEGELLPDTYDFYYNTTKDELINRMRKNMSSTLDQLWENRDDIILKNKEEALILASIVEKEAGYDGERGQVASVFINRLRKKMRLQSDPSVIYAITSGKYKLDRLLSKKDLRIDSVYNTYRVFGLPPTPICNPGIESIKSVMNPPYSDKYYFVANGEGGHNFASTLKEHNHNVSKWRKIQKIQDK